MNAGAEPLPESPPALGPWVGCALAVLFVAVNGFFVAAEFSLIKVRPTQINIRVKRGEVRAQMARHVMQRLDTYLSATQLGITLASLALGWIGEPAFAWVLRPAVMMIPGATPNILHSVSLTIAFVTITSLHIVLGELAPKWWGIKHPETVSLLFSIPLYGFHKLTFPFIWVLNKSVTLVLRLFGIQPMAEHGLAQSEEELRLLLSTEVEGRLSKQKRELLDNVFKLSHRTARQVMVPRADVTYLSLARTLQDNLEIAKNTEFTRFPLCTEDLDQTVGMINIKDLFQLSELPRSLQDIKREIHFVPETLTLDRLLRRMRREREHMVALVDEYGGVSGIVTLEDVIEEIVGQIQDEFDQENPDIIREKEGIYRVSGQMLVVDLEDALSIEFSERNEDTVGGVVLSEIGRSPKVGDMVEVGEVRFEVLEIMRRRIKTLRVALRPKQTAAKDRVSTA